jgi:hypothetical protein
MQMNPSPTELTTGATDAVLAFLAIACMAYLRRFRDVDPAKVRLWSWILGLLALASGLGAVAHGLDLPEPVWEAIWQPLFLSLGLVVALFVVAAIYDRFGAAPARRILPVMLVIGVIFYLLTLVFPGTFTVFVLYEAAAMVIALVLYQSLAIRERRAWAWLMVLGIALNIVAAGIQATGSVSVDVGIPLDHNGVFHLVQMVAVVVLVAGIAGSLVRPVPVR